MGGYQLKIEKYWSDDFAEEVYRLVEYEGERAVRVRAQNKDIEWAQRTAEHYGIDMPAEVTK